MRKIILDTNVLMSAILFGGVPAKILEAWYAGKFQMVLTEHIFDEYVRVYAELLNQDIAILLFKAPANFVILT